MHSWAFVCGLGFQLNTMGVTKPTFAIRKGHGAPLSDGYEVYEVRRSYGIPLVNLPWRPGRDVEASADCG